MAPPPASPQQWGTALVTALAQSRTRDTLSDEIEKTIVSLEKNHPDSAELIFAVGNLRYMQSRFEEAAQLYQAALRRDPNHVFTMNNLVLALAARDGDRAECFDLINRALTLKGRDPLLLDTLALLHVREGRPGEAIAALNEAIPDSEADDMMLLHLAHAYLLVGDEANARQVFGLLPSGAQMEEAMSPFDREMYILLTNQFTKHTTHVERGRDDVN
jgi:uncharacterized protein HemY